MESKNENRAPPVQPPSDPPAKTEEFNFEEGPDYDDVREKFEIIAIKMDIHKNGILYLKEFVRFSLLVNGHIIGSHIEATWRASKRFH